MRTEKDMMRAAHRERLHNCSAVNLQDNSTDRKSREVHRSGILAKIDR